MLKVTQQANSNVSPVIISVTFSVTPKVMKYRQEIIVSNSHVHLPFSAGGWRGVAWPPERVFFLSTLR